MIGPASADSMAWVFRHGSLILPDRVVDDGVVVCRGGRITAVGGAGEIPVPVAAVTIDQAESASLASTVVGLDTMVRNMTLMTDARLDEAVRMASLTPDERVGMAKEIGSLEVGKRADVVVLDRALAVQRVFIGGDEFERQTAGAEHSSV